MKIFHMGDWHIGKLVNGFYMTEDQEFIMNELYIKIEEEKPDVLIIAGDLYDRSIPPVQAVELLNEVFEKIAIDLKTPIISIAGNHDSNERLDFASRLLKNSGLNIVGVLDKDIRKVTLKDEFGEVDFYPIPYMDPPIVRDLFKDESIKTHDDAMRKITDNISMNMDKNKRNVAIAHGYITYTKGKELINLEESESEKPLSIGGTELIDSEYFKEFDYTALGHLHGPQKVGSDRIRYSGSLMKYSFSEVNQKKGITIVEIDREGNIEVKLEELVPRRDFRILKGELKELLSSKVASLGNTEDYIKAILTDKGEILDPMAKLRSVYPNAMELTREGKERLESNNRIVSKNIKEKSKINLFESFYEEIVEENPTEEEKNIMAFLIEECERGGGM